MIPTQFLVWLVGIVGVGLALALATIVGRRRLRSLRGSLHERLRAVGPYVALLSAVLAINTVARNPGQELSWLLGWNITGAVYAIEGTLVAQIQSYATPLLTAVLSFVYIYGYVFLLVFPLLAYLALPDLRPLRELLVAYGLNYAVGVVCYVLFIAYGPRNLMPELVEPLLFSNWPQSQLLVSQVNSNTNVFPSLHTSLSVTVALLSYRSRDRYPSWWYLSAPLSAGVVLSTMYLGIHWATDVVAGVVLAAVSVLVTVRLTDDRGEHPALTRAGEWLLATATYPFRVGLSWFDVTTSR